MERRAAYLRSLAVAAGIGVLGALLFIPVSAYAVTIAPDAPLLYAPIVGLWTLPVLASVLALRRPGVGMLTALVAGLASMPLSGYGYRALLSAVAVALVLEIALALARYRRWDKTYLAIVLAIEVLVLNAIGWGTLLRLDAAPLGVQLAYLPISLISVGGALVLAALLARLIENSSVGRWVAAPDGAGEAARVAGASGWQYDGGLAKRPDTTP